jgi:hypothetical protein
MRPRYKPPVNKRYFHKKRKIDNIDMVSLKKRINNIKQEKISKELERSEKKHF